MHWIDSFHQFKCIGVASIYSFSFLHLQFSKWSITMTVYFRNQSLLIKRTYPTISSLPFPLEQYAWERTVCTFFPHSSFELNPNQIFVSTTPPKQLLSRSPLISILLDSTIKSQAPSKSIRHNWYRIFYLLPPSWNTYFTFRTTLPFDSQVLHLFLCWFTLILPTSKYVTDPGFHPPTYLTSLYSLH